MKLSSRARNLLRDADQALRSASSIEKRRTQVVGEVAAWCAAHDIDLGARLTHDRLRFDRELLAQVDDALSSLGEAAISTDLRGLTSAEQARLGNLEAKSVREAPRQQRVLISVPAGAPRPGLTGRARDVLDRDWRDIDLDAFGVLLQVENLDSFYALPATLPALAHWPSPLILYRGDRFYGGAFAKVAETWASTGRPHLYLGDFDAKGVSLAISSRASHLLLPPLAWLIERVNAEHLPPKQQGYQTTLRDLAARLPADHSLVGYLRLLLDEQCGLRQQWFGHDLTPVPLG
ncbi:MAG: DUF7281 domain-containing protein [Pseudomonadota bacterium]